MSNKQKELLRGAKHDMLMATLSAGMAVCFLIGAVDQVNRLREEEVAEIPL